MSMMTKTDLRKHLAIEAREVTNLLNLGVLDLNKGYRDNIKSMINYYKKQHPDKFTPGRGKGFSERKGSLNKQRLELTYEQTRTQKIKNDLIEGKLAPIGVIEEFLNEVLPVIVTNISMIPKELLSEYPEVTPFLSEIIQRKINSALIGISRPEEWEAKLEIILKKHRDKAEKSVNKGRHTIEV